MANWLDPLSESEMNHALAIRQEAERQQGSGATVVRQPLSGMRLVRSSIGTQAARQRDRSGDQWRNRR